MNKTSAGPLSGIRVLDLSRILAGPFATMTLADLGAEVIKVEAPGKGDDTREWGPPFLAGESTYFLSVNRSKLGITLDFKKPKGRDLLLRLIERADVLIENFRTGALKRAGLAYEDLASRFPRLIYCSITGYGHTGPRRSEPGFDALIQGESGVMSVTGDPGGPPFKMGVSVADITTGMYAVQGILAALYGRQQTGMGQKIDVALLDSMISTLTYQSAIYFATGRTPERMGNRHPSIAPYETFEASDGYFTLGVTNDSQWHSFCRAVEVQDLESDPAFASVRLRVENYGTLRARLSTLFLTRTAAFWIGRLRTAGVPCGEVRTVSQALEDPQLRARDMILEFEHPVAGRIRCTGCPLKMSGSPAPQGSPPPLHGQHNREVYGAILGLSDEDLATLRSDGVI
jgi:crotonobetainyl-CoA:carnitine CoA-transferase CaiB-like acyl-CoA transferase